MTVDITPIGKTYNNLTVLSYFQDNRKGLYVKWFVCKCVCGEEKSVRSSLVLSGSVKSCGCKKWEAVRKGARDYALKTFDYPAERKRYSGYKVDAKRNHRTFEISFEEFLVIVNLDCNYCGSKPAHKISNKTRNRFALINGIDRVNSSKGYEKGNIVACCRICNMMKNTLNVDDFKKHIAKVYKHSAVK